MAKGILEQLEQLEKDIEEVANNATNIKKDVAREAANQIYDDLDYIFVACIDKFSFTYKPLTTANK